MSQLRKAAHLVVEIPQTRNTFNRVLGLWMLFYYMSIDSLRSDINFEEIMAFLSVFYVAHHRNR